MHSDVRFGWDGVLDPAWTTALDPYTCTGSMTLTPPTGAAPGDHEVTAQACYVGQAALTCEAWTAPQRVAVYTIPLPPPTGVLSIAKAGDVAQVAPGGTVTYTLTLTVASVASMSGVSIVDQLPVGFGNATAISGGGTFSAATNSITWSRITVTDGDLLTYRALVSPTAAPAQGPYVNTARISAGLCEICSASASVVVQPVPVPTATPVPPPRRHPARPRRRHPARPRP